MENISPAREQTAELCVSIERAAQTRKRLPALTRLPPRERERAVADSKSTPVGGPRLSRKSLPVQFRDGATPTAARVGIDELCGYLRVVKITCVIAGLGNPSVYKTTHWTFYRDGQPVGEFWPQDKLCKLPGQKKVQCNHWKEAIGKVAF